MSIFALFLYLLLLVVDARHIVHRQTRITRGSLQQITSDFGNNPSGVRFWIYVPNNLASYPGLVVAIHYCTGSAKDYAAFSPYKTQSEKYGYVVIYPESPHEGACWDVSSKATLTHYGGGDSNAIANMVSWTKGQFNIDGSKIVVTGTSSGAMMTNVMVAAYPDVFKAATVYAGVAAGCFVSASGGVDQWNATCAQGKTINTPEVWANVARNMFPGYSGPYPRIQLYHGGKDPSVYPQNYDEECKQWSAVNGYNYSSPQSTQANSPASGWTRTVYGNNVQGIFHPDLTHDLPIFAAEDMKWFGFA